MRTSCKMHENVQKYVFSFTFMFLFIVFLCSFKYFHVVSCISMHFVSRGVPQVVRGSPQVTHGVIHDSPLVIHGSSQITHSSHTKRIQVRGLSVGFAWGLSSSRPNSGPSHFLDFHMHHPNDSDEHIFLHRPQVEFTAEFRTGCVFDDGCLFCFSVGR